MIIPEVKIKKYIDSIIESIRYFCRESVPEQHNVLYQIFSDLGVPVELDGFNFYAQAKDVFVGKNVGNYDRLESRLSFDPTRASLPTVHITTPSEDNVDRSIGEDPEPTGDGYSYSNSFRASFDIIVTGRSAFECAIIYRSLLMMMVSTLDTLTHMGLYNPVVSGSELHIASDAVPQGILSKNIKLAVSYSGRINSAPTFHQAVNQLVFGGRIIEENLWVKS